MDSKFWSDMGKACAIAAVSTAVSRLVMWGMDSYYESSKTDTVAKDDAKPADKPKTDATAEATPATDPAATATAAANDEPAAEQPAAAAVRQRFSLRGNDDERGVA